MSESPTPTTRIVMPDGKRWLTLHLPSVNQQLEILDLPEGTTTEDEIERTRYWRKAISEATVETSWGGDVMDGITLHELQPVVMHWLAEAEDDALPLDAASSSATPAPEPPSEAPTAARRRSRSRRST